MAETDATDSELLACLLAEDDSEEADEASYPADEADLLKDEMDD